MNDNHPLQPKPPAALPRTHTTKDTVLDTVLALHRAGTWEETGLQRTAAAADVSRATLYNLFRHRDGLTQALLSRETGRLLDGASHRWHQARTRGAEPADCLTAAAAWMLAASRSHPLRRYVLPGHGHQPPGTGNRALTDLLTETRCRLTSVTGPDSHTHAVETVLRQTLSYLLLPAESHRHARAQIAHTARNLIPPATAPAATGPVPDHTPAPRPHTRQPGPEEDHR